MLSCHPLVGINCFSEGGDRIDVVVRVILERSLKSRNQWIKHLSFLSKAHLLMRFILVKSLRLELVVSSQ